MSHTPSISERQDDPMSWLFGEIYGMYGNLFLDKFRSGHVVKDGAGVERDTGIENMKAVWAQHIRENGMNFSEIKRGLKALDHLSRQFPPSWPEFFALCRPVPTVDDVIREAIVQVPLRATGEDVWTHPAIYWTARKVGFHDMVSHIATTLRPRVQQALASVLAEEVLPVPPATVAPMLPAPAVSEDVVQQAKQDFAALPKHVIKTADSNTNHLRWAHVIVERVRRGDRSISLYRLREAETALGLPPAKREVVQ